MGASKPAGMFSIQLFYSVLSVLLCVDVSGRDRRHHKGTGACSDEELYSPLTPERLLVHPHYGHYHSHGASCAPTQWSSSKLGEQFGSHTHRTARPSPLLRSHIFPISCPFLLNPQLTSHEPLLLLLYFFLL